LVRVISAPARNIPFTSSLAPSIARRIVDPFADRFRRKNRRLHGDVVPRHTLTTPTG